MSKFHAHFFMAAGMADYAVCVFGFPALEGQQLSEVPKQKEARVLADERRVGIDRHSERRHQWLGADCHTRTLGPGREAPPAIIEWREEIRIAH